MGKFSKMSNQQSNLKSLTKEQILAQIADLFQSPEVAHRDRLAAGQILLKQAESGGIGVEARAKLAMDTIVGKAEPDCPAVGAIEHVIEPGKEYRMMDMLDMIDKEISNHTNRNRLAVELRGKGWTTRKVQGYVLWKAPSLNVRSVS